jgi:hypothetical protein
VVFRFQQLEHSSILPIRFTEDGSVAEGPYVDGTPAALAVGLDARLYVTIDDRIKEGVCDLIFW